MDDEIRSTIEKLLSMLEQEEPVLVVTKGDHEGLPTIHNFYPKKYYPSIEHLGFGFFSGETEHGKFNFDAGGAMRHVQAGEEWLSWSPLRTDNGEVMKDLGYDFEKAKSALRKILEAS